MTYTQFVKEIEKLLKQHVHYRKHIDDYDNGWEEVEIFDKINRLRKTYPEYDEMFIKHLLFMYEQECFK